MQKGKPLSKGLSSNERSCRWKPPFGGEKIRKKGSYFRKTEREGGLCMQKKEEKKTNTQEKAVSIDTFEMVDRLVQNAQQALKEYMELNIIQIAPLAFMRGRTLNDAVVILDEAQNTTTQQIKMFLTRMGMNTKMIVTGDMTQIDLPASQTSGLVQALRILKGVKGISFVELNKKDIVRHKLVERIVDAYEKFDKEAKAEREKRKNEQLIINGERPVKQVNN